MRALVCGDLHLKPAASDYDVDALTAPSDVDAVFLVGDLTHRDGPDDVALARRFVSQFPADVPLVYVPGNHDHAPMPTTVTEDVPGATTGHRLAHDVAGVTVVGWGCERRSLTRPIDQRAFPAIDPRTVPRQDRRYAADQTAADLEAACYDAICGTATTTAVADRLGLSDDNRRAFAAGLDTVRDTYDELAALLADREDVLLLTHVPPFNTSFDRHHSTGSRDGDQDGLHVGSIALKLALRSHDVFATVSGHSHCTGYDTGDHGDGRPHALNLGYRGLGTITCRPNDGEFGYTTVPTS